MSQIMCPECGENPAAQRHKCNNMSLETRNTFCFCCHECTEACWEDYCEMIESGDADLEVIEYYKGD